MSYQLDDHGGILKGSAVTHGLTHITREVHVHTRKHTRALYKLYKEQSQLCSTCCVL